MKEYNDGVKSENSSENDRSDIGRLTISGLVFAAFLAATAVSAQTAPSSALRLIGMIDGGSLRGAVLQDSTGKQTFYGLYDTLPDGSKIVKLREDSISLKSQDGALYDMYISHDTKTSAVSDSVNKTASQTAPAFSPPVSDSPPARPPLHRDRRSRYFSHDDE